MAWLTVMVMYLLRRGAACFQAAPLFLGNKTVCGTKGRKHSQPGRSLSLACAASYRPELRDCRRSKTLPRRPNCGGSYSARPHRQPQRCRGAGGAANRNIHKRRAGPRIGAPHQIPFGNAISADSAQTVVSGCPDRAMLPKTPF